MLRNPLILLFLLVPFISTAQAKPFSFRNIGINQGLSQSSVVDIAIDQTGFVWMATQDGLNRFDGNEFIPFPVNFDDITTPTGNQLGKISRGEGHQLWLISRGGKLQKMDLLTQLVTPFPKIKGETIPAAGCVFQDSVNLFIGTRSEGLWIYQRRGNQLNKLTTKTDPSIISNEIKNVFKDSRGDYWVLTANGVVVLNGSLQVKNSFLQNARHPLRTSAISEDQHGTIWIATFGQGIFFKKKNASVFQEFTSLSGIELKDSLVTETILADRQGMIWIGTFSNGLYIIDQQQQTIHHLSPDKKDPFSLAYIDVLCIVKDDRGGVWIGTDGGGVSYYDKRLDNFETFSRNNLPEHVSVEQVRAITTDHDNNIWAGTSVNGLSILGDQPATVGAYKKIGSLLTDKDGDIWIGTQENGLDIMNARSKKIIRKFLPGETIWTMLEDASGNVWAATRQQGLYLLNKKNGELLHFDDQHSPMLAENNVRTLAFTKDSLLFIGFEKAGIQLLDTRQRKILSLPKPVDSTFNGSVLIRSMYYTPDILWVGTFGNGLLAFELPSGKATAITEKQGLRNNTIYGIQPDQRGSIWLSTNKGLCRLRIPTDVTTIRRADMFFFTVEDGLQSNEFNTGAHYRSPDGHLYFGGINGLSFFDPASLISIEQPGSVIITAVQADDKPLQTDTLITYKKILELPYSQNSISFTFAAFDVLSAGRLNYSYKLSGLDKDWFDAGTRNYAAYTHLPSGKYTFYVKATRNFSTENAPVTSLVIVIEPPFWRTPWFIILCVLLLAASLYGIYRYRISQLIRLQKVRNRIASDLHDDIGSALTHINILSELSKAGVDPKAETAGFLDRITEEVTNCGQSLDDIVWSINSNNDTMEQMVARMRRYVAEVLETRVEKYTVDFDDRFANRKLNMEQRRDFFLLFKELINNIYKHSRASQVDIRVWLERNTLHLRVSDNGIGFDQTKSTERNGVKNMHARTEKWGGKIEIRSAPEAGTVIKIAMQLV
ncbi:MAG: hypothetical protein DI535_13680 [Citrobacter freundii]|nr:MAG: hypothetical protein DI535_13680 [Citrobacter freundii]